VRVQRSRRGVPEWRQCGDGREGVVGPGVREDVRGIDEGPMTDHVKTLASAREHLIDSLDAYFVNAELEAVDVVNALDAYLTERARRPPEPVATSEATTGA